MATTTSPAAQPLLIDGAWRDAADGRTHDHVGAWSGAVVTRQAAAGVADVDAAVAAAHAAFPTWAATAPQERRAILARAADLLEERIPEIAAAVTEETGGTFGWGAFNATLAAKMLREAGAQAYGLAGELVPTDVPGLTSTGVRVPVGVCVGIAPWNAPVILGARAVCWALAYGNTVVLKASEKSPRVHGHVVGALVDAGAPDGVVNLVTNAPGDAPQVVEALVAHPSVARVNFTGSTRVGRIIAEVAARHLKRTLLELGGKAPLVVLDDADLDAAAAAASFGAFMHQGQICMSTERVVADASVVDDVVGRLAERAGALVVGDPTDRATQIGPVVDEASREHCRALIDDATARGARIAAGGTFDGPLLHPTVVAGVTEDMRLYHEESFGPLLAVVSVDGEDEAVRVANDTQYGLSAAVFGRDVPRAKAVAARIESGICHVNGATVHDEPFAPFGGVKQSGWGRFGARAGLDEFTELRWLTVSEQPRHYPI